LEAGCASVFRQEAPNLLDTLASYSQSLGSVTENSLLRLGASCLKTEAEPTSKM